MATIRKPMIAVARLRRIQGERVAGLALGNPLSVEEQLERLHRSVLGRAWRWVLAVSVPRTTASGSTPSTATRGGSAQGRQSGSPTINNW